jgi:transposase-like protein
MPESFRALILAALDAPVNELATWLDSNWDAGFVARERYVLLWGRRVLTLVFTLALSAARLSWGPKTCPHCRADAATAWRRAEPRTIVSACGVVQLTRQRLECRACHRSWLEPDAVSDLPGRTRVSPVVTEWLTTLGGLLPFRQASKVLEHLTGLALSWETVRQHAEAQGAALAQEAATVAATVERTREPVGPVDPAPGLLLVEIDGVLLRYLDGWHEVKIGVVGGWQDGRATELSYCAARLPAETFGGRVAAEAAHRGSLEIVGWEGEVTGRGLARLRQVVILGDGARWIWNLADDQFGERIEILDWFHASEHLWKVARAVFGAETPQTTTWANAQLRALRTAGPEPVLAALAALKPKQPDARKAVQDERRYFQANCERMQYPLYEDDGLPLGSGAVESACGHVLQHRMKRSGMRWSAAGGDAMVALCAHLATHPPAPIAA